MKAGQCEGAASAYEKAWEACPNGDEYAFRAALAYDLVHKSDSAQTILRKLSVSKNLPVAQAAVAQIRDVEAPQETRNQ